MEFTNDLQRLTLFFVVSHSVKRKREAEAQKAFGQTYQLILHV